MASKPLNKNSPSPRKKLSLKLWLGVPFALFIVVLIILSQIDLESVKEDLVKRIAEETGLQVEIGSMGFGFSHGLGLQCKGVKVNTPEGHHLSVKSLHLLAEWMPLLTGEVKIKSAALVQPEVTLEMPEAPSEAPAAVDQKPPEKEELIAPATIESTKNKLKDTQLSIEKFILSDGKVTLVRPGINKQLILNVYFHFRF